MHLQKVFYGDGPPTTDNATYHSKQETSQFYVLAPAGLLGHDEFLIPHTTKSVNAL
jgi:hypothetical protein